MKRYVSFVRKQVLRKLGLSMLSACPIFACAAGGGDVQLAFTDCDKRLLYFSLAFGVLAIIVGTLISRMILSQSSGSDKMKEVGLAIRQGALAYLKKQMSVMSIFVLLLAVGLFALYNHTYGASLALSISLSFIGGVACSYISGYVGMMMAVNGNTRTAFAATTSYKKSLETAFRSGSVAGLVTVGLGLIGATTIFLLAGAHSMKLLVGFGFGGSLAALFMRVGGGIFTKAADVGADLVGKVESNIPEDDPRNPAVIADAVGDNVGDCAGMAADVFESYGVTLVAAIILGAATSALFETHIWMKLVLFALMAYGIGIFASIVGIFSVKGKDDLNADPLTSIRSGFNVSALITVLGVTLVSMLMFQPNGKDIVIAHDFIPRSEAERQDMQLIRKVQSALAHAQKKDISEITVEDIRADKRIQNHFELKAPTKDAPFDMMQMQVNQYLSQGLNIEDSILNTTKDVHGYQKVDFKKPSELVKNLTIQKAEKVMRVVEGKEKEEEVTKFVSFVDEIKDKKLVIVHAEITQRAPTPPVKHGQPQPPTPAPMIQKVYAGPVPKVILDSQVKNNPNVKILKEMPIEFYVNEKGELLISTNTSISAMGSTGIRGFPYFNKNFKELEKLQKENKPLPTMKQSQFATVKSKSVEWWRFALCITFGILMGFAIERLTNYYVSTNKRPVREVANLATTGPAPMLIQGFAYGKESSVMNVFAIVLALIMPMIIFPPEQFNGYILSFYGIALIGIGLLSNTAYILAMDTFGPISDNAQGIFEMSGASELYPKGALAVQRLDAAGNTTKALTKGFAIATAVIASVALFHSYIKDTHLNEVGLRLEIPEIFLGLMIGGAVPYLFSAFATSAVGRAAFDLIHEVRTQFRNDPGIMAGTSKPDYARCVAIVTQAAQRELLAPGIMAIAFPVLVGFGFSIGKPLTSIHGMELNLVGAQALGGFLAGAIVSGQLLAVMLANSGGMWDNCKKLIEDGLHGGKGTDEHKASVVCDTVGDPFKDTAGPAMNPLIKVMNMVGLLIAPLIIMPHSQQMLIGVTLITLAVLVIFLWMPKKKSLNTEFK